MLKSQVLKNENKLPKIWTRDFSLMSLSALTLYMSYQMMLTILPSFITEKGGNQFTVGLIISLYTIASLFTRPIAGNLTDKIGRKPVVFAGLLLFTLCVGSYYWLATIQLILALRLIHGVSWGIASTSLGTAASDIIPKSRYGEGLGYFGLAGTLGMALGPNLGIITMNYGSGLSFTITSLLSLISLILLNMVKFPSLNLEQKKFNTADFIKNLWEKKALVPGSLALFIGMTYGGITSYITLFAKEQNLRNIGIFFLCNASMLAVSRLFAGKVFDKKGPYILLFPSILFCMIGLLLLSFSNSVSLLALSGIFYGFGFGLILPTLQAWAVTRVDSKRRGAATGTYYSSLDLGIAMGSVILGIISKTTGYAGMYLYSNIFILFFFIICSYYYLKEKIINKRS